MYLKEFFDKETWRLAQIKTFHGTCGFVRSSGFAEWPALIIQHVKQTLQAKANKIHKLRNETSLIHSNSLWSRLSTHERLSDQNPTFQHACADERRVYTGVYALKTTPYMTLLGKHCFNNSFRNKWRFKFLSVWNFHFFTKYQ